MRTRLTLILTTALVAFAAAAAAAAVLVRAPAIRAATAPAKTKTITVISDHAPRGLKGLAGAVGPRGLTGARGAKGPPGVVGPDGPPAIVSRSATINWQNGQSSGRDAATFSAPGIGTGVVTCRSDDQEIRFTPAGGSDVVMWTINTRDTSSAPNPTDYGPLEVREAKYYKHADGGQTGDSFFVGMNLFSGQQQANGTFTGLISSQGDPNTDGGPTVSPTAFRLSYYWDFSNAASARCYVAATFTTKA